MAYKISLFSWLCFLCLTYGLLISRTAAEDLRKSYIVYLGEHPKGEFSPADLHLNMLQDVIGSEFSSDHLLHSFKRSFNGFVVNLSEEEAQLLAGMPDVISMFPNGEKTLHTTKSWDFMGFPKQVKRTNLESDIVIGVFDSGIWPESKSFTDEGFGPPPSKWKGSCHSSSNITCNNKIIGAKYYRSDQRFGPDDIISPRDTNGHGTHTASTAAGNLVSMASQFGLALGTARGGVPSARIAVYKICWATGCSDADILAAFDDAIADGVDIISLSVGDQIINPTHYFNDSLAIGAFHAMRKGILTSFAAGNLGPGPYSLANFAPWSLTVAASTIDRNFVTKIKLGNNRTYEGISANTFDLNNEMYPFIYGGDAPNITGNFSQSESRLCMEYSLDPELVKGKIVLCDLANREEPFRAGAVGAVMQGPARRDRSFNFPIPASILKLENNSDILFYLNSTSNPTATIYKSTEENNTFAPFVPMFSSRGPNPITPDVLKPDIVAPGVDILAAYSEISPVSGVEGDKRFAPFNIQSGTSMACPHATAVAAYVKSYHPTWSPSAIKSAIMTTAFPMSPDKNPEAEFAYGSGNINPVQAIDPGLIYDATPYDYIKFLCGQGYNSRLLRNLTEDNTICTKQNSESVFDLNYPSFALALTASDSESFIQVFNRTVTNVGIKNSTYKATVTSPPGLKIQVRPNILSFTSLGEKRSFVLTVEGTLNTSMVSASLVWSDGVYQVRSPIVVYLFSS